MPTGVVAAAVDITDRRRAEAALHESEGRLFAILDHTPAMVYVVGTDNRFQFINRRWKTLFGLSNKDVAGRSIYEFFPRDVADGFAANNRLVLDTLAPLEVEESAPAADGLRTYISVKVRLFDAGGQAYAVCGISSDITELKRAEARNRLLVALDDAVGRWPMQRQSLRPPHACSVNTSVPIAALMPRWRLTRTRST